MKRKEVFVKVVLTLQNLSQCRKSDEVIYRMKEHSSLIPFWRKLNRKILSQVNKIHKVKVDICINDEKIFSKNTDIRNEKFLYKIVENKNTEKLDNDYHIFAYISFYCFLNEDLMKFDIKLEDRVVFRELF
ncbi:hypothetical protein YS40_111 [Thermus phage phiYS40]|uniref:hypothetical protein n=1 Tax=Thermus phage phiYS40 TaxID=407392 RepID=UPI0000E689E5|nr:hypothetical protein YS40_111 [Thermus phage phiYS40]ABJ91505.1 hypothetical protein YS40_111 [Thermus phage phiYS40]BAK53629.1 hypothetical protein YSP_111 [Thermus phage phiYS40]